mgnify:CR=1 FL=1
MRELPVEEVAGHLALQFERLGIDPAAGPQLADLVTVQADRVKTLKEMAEQSRVFYEDYGDFDENAAKKHLRPVAEAPLVTAMLRGGVAMVLAMSVPRSWAYRQSLIDVVFGDHGVGREVVAHIFSATSLFNDYYANFDRILHGHTGRDRQRLLDHRLHWQIAKGKVAHTL